MKKILLFEFFFLFAIFQCLAPANAVETITIDGSSEAPPAVKPARPHTASPQASTGEKEKILAKLDELKANEKAELTPCRRNRH